MILACEIAKYSSLTTYQIERVLDRSGYSMCSFENSGFVGITKSGDFMYWVTYCDEAGTGTEQGNVYINKDDSGEMRAEF